MAQQGAQLDEEQLCCSVCLDVLKEPVTVPCGHSYCRRCIEGYWDQDDQRGRYSCPQCRHVFDPRPVLKKNTMLAEVVECMKKTGLQAAPPDRCYAGRGDVACDVCTGRRLKAVKTCLQCLVSYCDAHLQPHHQSPAFKKHKLVKASKRQKQLDTIQKNIQQRIQGREIDLKVLRQELESVNLCADRTVEDIDGIFTELIFSMERRWSEEREKIRDRQERQVSCLEEPRSRVEQEVTELRRRHAELEQLSHTEDHIHFLQLFNSSVSMISESIHPVSSDASDSRRYFEDATVAVSKMRDKLEGILTEEGTAVLETVKRLRVRKSIREKRKNINKAQALLSTSPDVSKMGDKLEGILTEEGTAVLETVNRVRESKREKRKNINKAQAQALLSTSLAVSKMRDKVEGILTEEGTAVLVYKRLRRGKRSKGVNKAQALLSTLPEPNTRAEFLEYSRPITLDPNTAHQRLSLSDGNRKATLMDEDQSYPYHAERFTWGPQVLSREGMSGRCYWEVEWSGRIAIIGVSYKDISRTGFEVECSTSNPKTWALYCTTQGYWFTSVQCGRVSSRVGVYLDHSAGILSFYSVAADTMTLLHTVHTTFTHHLHAGFHLGSEGSGTTVELCEHRRGKVDASIGSGACASQS